MPRWADRFCRDFQTWLEGITSQSESLSTDVDPDDIGALRTAIVGLFDGLARQTEVLVDQIEKTGPPDIADGDRFIEDLIGKFESFGQVVEGARQKAEAADVTDPTSFRNTITSLVAEFQAETEAVTRTFSELDARYNSPELNTALDDECSFLHGSLPT